MEKLEKIFSQELDGVLEEVYFKGTLMIVFIDGKQIGEFDFKSTYDEILEDMEDSWSRQIIYDKVLNADVYFSEQYGDDLPVDIESVTDTSFFEDTRM